MNFYALIIGSEILNARREDKHFNFLRAELQKFGHELYASFILKDDAKLIQKSFELILSDRNSVLFCFGGIGSTPDDLTREIAARVFTSKPLVRHKKFEQDIIDKFASEAYPHRIHMADLPEHSALLFNPINNMSGFSLQNRFFFTPGFPSMAHPMIRDVIQKFFSISTQKFRCTLLANTSENSLIAVMKQIPAHIELSSLPIFTDGNASVEISLKGENKKEVQSYFHLFIDELHKINIPFTLI
ncbi:competence/damage-inducible protein A [bacterium]|nr:competence/damage-inducible protein A [bacterium]MBU1995455.1 competence/damage-inducible protein A [bacterium]